MTPSTTPAFTAPKTTTDISILDAPNLYFYSWLLAFMEYVHSTYGITLLPGFQKIAGIETGSPFNVFAFYLFSPELAGNYQHGWTYIPQGVQWQFEGRMDDLAQMELSCLSFPNPAPQKLAIAVPVGTPPVAPPNPLGHAFTPYGAAPGTFNYTDVGLATITLGTVYENTDGSVAPSGKYVKQGRQLGPFGVTTWWAPFPSTASL